MAATALVFLTGSLRWNFSAIHHVAITSAITTSCLVSSHTPPLHTPPPHLPLSPTKHLPATSHTICSTTPPFATTITSNPPPFSSSCPPLLPSAHPPFAVDFRCLSLTFRGMVPLCLGVALSPHHPRHHHPPQQPCASLFPLVLFLFPPMFHSQIARRS
jgi:hypothetical protein